MMKQDEKKEPSTKGGDWFKPSPKDNGAYTDKSMGKNLGNPMQDLIGTEKIENPIKE
jgi:hypothetical protein